MPGLKSAARRRSKSARPPAKQPFVFTYRCPAHLIGPLNEARFTLREPTRTGLITKAIEEYLVKRHIPLEATG